MYVHICIYIHTHTQAGSVGWLSKANTTATTTTTNVTLQRLQLVLASRGS